eukprot:COSAG06_NODE_544_length_14458_cov_18.391671_13_plen_74_part_00
MLKRRANHGAVMSCHDQTVQSGAVSLPPFIVQSGQDTLLRAILLLSESSSTIGSVMEVSNVYITYLPNRYNIV